MNKLSKILTLIPVIKNYVKEKVLYFNYPLEIDLSGKDLISLGGQNKENLDIIFGKIKNKSEMEIVKMKISDITSMNNKIADEIHFWPNASQGKMFKGIKILLKDNNIIEVQWKL